MHYRELGNTGVEVSEVGLGCNRLGQSYASDAHWSDLVLRAVDLGVTLFDTAEAYGWGRSEEMLGNALGNRDDVPDLLAASDLFVLPSLWEGLPMALIEAMASGLPIVATEVSGTIRVMVPGQTGILVPPGDAQKLAEAILQLLSDPERARAMGKAARRRVEREFSAQKQAEEHLALYHRLLRGA